MKIIIPLNLNSFKELKHVLENLNPQINIVEIWIDKLINEFMQHPRKALEARNILKKIQREKDIQFLAVCKTPLEKGNFLGTPEQKIQILKQFLSLGGNFIDLDIRQNSKNLIDKIPGKKLWLSFHDFEGLNLESIKIIYKGMQDFDPYLYKFAVTPQSETELNNFIAWAEEFTDIRAIFTTMGKFGEEGRARLKNITWGGFFALDEGHKTASGQMTLNEFLET